MVRYLHHTHIKCLNITSEPFIILVCRFVLLFFHGKEWPGNLEKSGINIVGFSMTEMIFLTLESSHIVPYVFLLFITLSTLWICVFRLSEHCTHKNPYSLVRFYCSFLCLRKISSFILLADRSNFTFIQWLSYSSE